MFSYKTLAVAVFTVLILILASVNEISAQAHGGGRPATAGPPPGAGRPATTGQPVGTGVDRGIGNASTRSNGRSDDGLGNADLRSNGRSSSGIDRARLAKANANAVSDNELNRYRGLSKKLGITPAEMRARYEAALLANPNLKYGQFVSANVVADNLGGRFPGITSSAILAGYQNGDSLGHTLRNLGMTKDQAKITERDAEMKIDDAKRRNH